MKCEKCGSKMTMQVLATIQAPAELTNNLTKKALQRKEVQILGVNWETADYICTNPNCGHVDDGYGNYVTNLKKENEMLKAKLKENGL